MCEQNGTEMAIDVREFWDFDDPALSEKRFRSILRRKTLSRDDKLEIWAQVARTFSLRNECPKCHAVLDEFWDDAMMAGPRPKACFELERGRAFRSGGDVPSSIPYFQIAATSEAEDLKVDAIHMLAIVATGAESRRLNLEALEIAKQSKNPWAVRWQGTLCNNLGWGYFDEENFSEAITWFRKTVEQREIYGNPTAIRIAKWCLARALRANGELDKAQAIQAAIIEQGADGFAYEEMGEILYALGKVEEAKPYFRRAADQLEAQLGPDSERIKRIRSLG